MKNLGNPRGAARRSTLALAAFVLGTVAPAVLAHAPLVDHARFHDPKLPPPCAAEGACRPKRDTTGYYPTRWRRWPGEGATPSGADAEKEKSALPEIEPIDPKLEDREAPKPSEELEEPEGGAVDSSDISLPPLPPLPDRGFDADPPAPAEDRGVAPPAAPFPRRPPGASITPTKTPGAAPPPAPSFLTRPAPSLSPIGVAAASADRSEEAPRRLPPASPTVSNAAWVVSGDAQNDAPPAFSLRRLASRASAVVRASAAGRSPQPLAEGETRIDPAVSGASAVAPAGPPHGDAASLDAPPIFRFRASR